MQGTCKYNVAGFGGYFSDNERIMLYFQSCYIHLHACTCRRILGQFSWLAVHSLSEAAEASSAPVRIGVSKPLGASSVLPEYQGKYFTVQEYSPKLVGYS